VISAGNDSQHQRLAGGRLSIGGNRPCSYRFRVGGGYISLVGPSLSPSGAGSDSLLMTGHGSVLDAPEERGAVQDGGGIEYRRCEAGGSSGVIALVSVARINSPQRLLS
jgi:hypothetical protein